MPLPDFTTLMLPLLSILADGNLRAQIELREATAIQLKISKDDLAELHSSGTRTTFANRIAWALRHLTQAQLVVSPARGHYRITDKGRTLLGNPLAKIDITFLATNSELSTNQTSPNTSPTPAQDRDARFVPALESREARHGFGDSPVIVPSKSANPEKTMIFGLPLLFSILAAVCLGVVVLLIYQEEYPNGSLSEGGGTMASIGTSPFLAVIDVIVREDAVDFKLEMIGATDGYGELPALRPGPICIHTVSVAPETSLRMVSGNRTFSFSAQRDMVVLPTEVCNDSPSGPRNRIDLGTVVVAEKHYFSRWRYPYDDIAYSQYFGFFDKDGLEVHVDRIYKISFSDRWRIVSGSLSNGVYAFVYSRSLIAQTMTALLVLLSFVLILLIQFVEETGAFAQVAVALLFGIWGARQITVPTTLNLVIGLDMLYVALYALLGCSVLFRVLVNNRSRPR